MIRPFLIALSIFAASATAGTVVVPASGAATYNGYYAWGSGTSWVWIPGGGEAHYYSDCYPCYYWDHSRVYLEFGLPASSAPILSATLRVNVTGFQDYDGSAGSAALYHQGDTSALTGDAYADRGALSAGEHVLNVVNPGIGWVPVSVTSFIASDYAQGENWTAFAFTPTGNGWGNSLLQFDGATLEIVTADATPEPSTLLLLGLGGALLFVRRKR
jgi:hypothetical protein